MQINSNVNVKNNPTLTQALLKYMEQNNIKKDTDVLENFLTEFSKTLDMPVTEEEKPEEPAPEADIDKWINSLSITNGKIV